jgi:Predicted permeases
MDMDIKVVVTQMMVMFLLILTGYFMYQKKFLSDSSTTAISGLILNLFNPALIMSSALSKERIATTRSIIYVLIISFLVFFFLVLLGFVMPKILRVKKEEIFIFKLLTVFGNTGFIGIPLTNAIFGSGAVIYASLFNIPYNIFLYSYGIYLIVKSKDKTSKVPFDFKKVINIGTISCIVTVILFLINPPLPEFATKTLSSLGAANTPLSMMVLGVCLAQLPLKSIFSNIRLYFFAFIRILFLPIAIALLLKPVIHDPIIFGVTILIIAMPCGSMPIMLVSKHGIQSNTLSEGVVLTTILSLVTISIISFFL